MIYKDKGQDEINGMLQTFTDAYAFKYGEELTADRLTSYLNALLKKKEEELIDNALGSLSPNSIRLMLKTLQDLNKEKLSNSKQETLVKVKDNTDCQQKLASESEKVVESSRKPTKKKA